MTHVQSLLGGLEPKWKR